MCRTSVVVALSAMVMAAPLQGQRIDTVTIGQGPVNGNILLTRGATQDLRAGDTVTVVHGSDRYCRQAAGQTAQPAEPPITGGRDALSQRVDLSVVKCDGPFDAGTPGNPRWMLPVDLRPDALARGRLRVTVVRGAQPAYDFSVPVVAPPPTVRRLNVRQGATVRDTLHVVPRRPASAQLEIELEGAVEGVRASVPPPLRLANQRLEDLGGRKLLKADLSLDPLPSYEQPIGLVPITIGYDSLGGSTIYNIPVRGEGPEVFPRPITVRDGEETIEAEVSNVADGAMVYLTVGRTDYGPVHLGDQTGAKVVITQDLFRRTTPGSSMQGQIWVVNPDGQASPRKPVTLTHAPDPAVGFSNVLTAGVRQSVTLRRLDPALTLQTGSPASIRLLLDGTLVPWVGTPTTTDSTISGYLEIPDALAPTDQSVRGVAITLETPAVQNPLSGEARVRSRPRILRVGEAVLRPGETRAIRVSGQRLDSMTVDAEPPLSIGTVVATSPFLATIPVAAAPDAGAGDHYVRIAWRNQQVDSFRIQVEPWMSAESLEARARIRLDGGDALELDPKGLLSVPHDARVEIAVRAPPALAAKELVRGIARAGGEKVWSDSVWVSPGEEARFPAHFQPGLYLKPGETGRIELSSPGGAWIAQKIRLKYPGGLHDWDIGATITAVQLPFGGEARDRYRPGSFNGIGLHTTPRVGALSNRLRLGDYDILRPAGLIGLAALETAPATEGGDPGKEAVFNVGLGLEWFNTVLTAFTWHTGGRDAEGFAILIGGSLDVGGAFGDLID